MPKTRRLQLHIQPLKPGLAAEKAAVTTLSFKAPELQEPECPFPVWFILQKGMAAMATASAEGTQARQQLRCA